MFTEYDLEVEIRIKTAKQTVVEDARDFYGRLLGQPLDIETIKEIVSQANKFFPSWVIMRMDWVYKDIYCVYAFDEEAVQNLSFNSRDIEWGVYGDDGGGFGVFDLTLPEDFVDCGAWGIDRNDWENFIRIEEGVKMLNSVR